MKWNADQVRRWLLLTMIGVGGLIVGMVVVVPIGGNEAPSAAVGATIRTLSPEALRALIGAADTTPLAGVQSGGEVVASRNGSVYYPTGCSAAQRIRDENRVWFASLAEAEQEGYRAAKNCR